MGGERRIWVPSAPMAVAGPVDPGFHGFASEWSAGLRIHEAAALTWRDVDLARGRITVGRSRRTPASAPSTSFPCTRTS